MVVAMSCKIWQASYYYWYVCCQISSTDFRIFSHEFFIVVHVCACRHGIL